MKKIIPILIVSILVLSGLGAVATQTDDAEYKKIDIAFSTPIVEDNQENVEIIVKETDSYLMKQNQPMLPKYTQTLMFPFGTKIKSVSCTPKNIETKQLSKQVMPTPQMQVAGNIVTSITGETTPKVYPESWYEYSVHSGLNGNVRSVLVNVVVYPVQYNSDELTIDWVDEVEIKVEYEESNPVLRTTNDEYDFLIIAEDQYQYDLDNLAIHKEYRDVSTKVVSLSDIYYGNYFTVQGNDDQEQIKYFIKDAIENWNVKYVMLVGRDVPTRDVHVQVPGSTSDDTEIFVSDLYYADIYDGQGKFSDWDSNSNGLFAEVNWDGYVYDQLDLYPDVHLGRIACNDGLELNTVVDKIINYEESYAYSSGWFKDLIAVGGDSFPGDYNQLLEGEVVNDHIIDIMDDFIPNRIWVSQEELTTRIPLNNALNGGAGFVDFSGHGNTNVWSTHPHTFSAIWLPAGSGYFSSNVLELTNGDQLPIVITGACSVGKFNKDDNCFCWSWLKNENGGGIGSFGATGLGYAYMGEYVTYGLIERVTIETFSAYKSGAIMLGQMWSEALNNYMQTIGLEGEADYKAVLEWQFFGDPTLEIAEMPNSDPPEKPARPYGQAEGDISVEYDYVSSAVDPDGDEVYYLFDWGDGSNSGWLGPYYSGEDCYASHTFTTSGEYWIKVKAKDTYGLQSSWSDPLGVRMPRGRALQLPLLEKIFERFPNLFSILQNILG